MTETEVRSQETKVHRRTRIGNRATAFVRNSLLNVAAVGGAVCIIAVVCAVLFKITLIMFSTGSMSPAIPAGSLAVVREIPASQIAVGDVVTVDRPNELPVTHRVQTIRPGEDGARVITMKGDANEHPDPRPYVVDTVRIVMFSVPELGYIVGAISTPTSLGIITLAVAALVTWVLWPRSVRPGAVDDDGGETFEDQGNRG
ncbi:signal peptidase I [Arthrobacter castelli]|uniref:signal peptidase I n=1 Tax=Arthrobacter castelli TaxID=271431 RepID=UPI0004187B3A|nr:signal peptidase I [Arthrobacter castelli]